jgi:hypothetical protein
MQIAESVECTLGELASLRCHSSLSGQAGHLCCGSFLHPQRLLCMCGGLSSHCVPQCRLALAGSHDFRGNELHVWHARFGGSGGSAKLHLLELSIMYPFFHFAM